MAVATDGEVFDRLVVFLKRMFWCIRTAKLGCCDRSERLDLVGEGQSASHFCLLSVLGGQPVEIKGGKLPIKLKLTKGLKYREGTYNIIRDFMLRIDHVAVHVSRYPEKMFFPFYPPPSV